jgi:hypothetical protein
LKSLNHARDAHVHRYSRLGRSSGGPPPVDLKDPFETPFEC